MQSNGVEPGGDNTCMEAQMSGLLGCGRDNGEDGTICGQRTQGKGKFQSNDCTTNALSLRAWTRHARPTSPEGRCAAPLAQKKVDDPGKLLLHGGLRRVPECSRAPGWFEASPALASSL